MQIDKSQIIDMLKSDHDKADQAQAELPDTVDTDAHAYLLAKHGVDPKALMGDAGGALGGLGG